jgi:hypothetical protein
MTADLWRSFDPRAAAKRIQDRASRPAKVANPANPGQEKTGFSQISRISQPASVSLSPSDQDWPPEEWAYRFHERVGFLHHDCGVPRPEAQQRAIGELQGHWRARHPLPATTPEAGCTHCGGLGGIDLVPILAEKKSHTWVHSKCWHALDQARRSEALAALTKMIPDLPEGIA